MEPKKLSARRKASVPELDLMSARRVPDYCMDSPTIPGRFPIHERSNSAPEQQVQRDVRIVDIPEPVDEIPPAVPPKSPRMQMRLSSAKRQGNQRLGFKYNAPQQVRRSASTSHRPGTGNGKPSQPISRPESRQRGRVPPSSSGSGSNSRPGSRERASPSPASATADKPERLRLFPTNKRMQDRPNSRPNTPQGETVGLAMRRSQRSLPRLKEDGAKEAAFTMETVPEMSPVELPSSLSKTEENNASPEKAEKRYTVQARRLSQGEIKQLTRELRVLSERCEYLRKTYRSLRDGRNDLQRRKIAYLRSPRLAGICRESLLRQEEALRELDHSIDEWHTKLEQVEDRRAYISKRLLQHIALTGQPPVDKQQQTPPESPVQDDENDAAIEFTRDEEESVKIYADSQVFADVNMSDLLVDIERQMRNMHGLRDSAYTMESE